MLGAGRQDPGTADILTPTNGLSRSADNISTRESQTQIIFSVLLSGFSPIKHQPRRAAATRARGPETRLRSVTSQKDANHAHARLRSPGEPANAQLKTWHILRKLRCCPWKAGQLAKAIHVRQERERRG